MMNLEGYEPGPVDHRRACPSRTAGSSPRSTRRSPATTADLEAFRFAEAARRLRDFTWGEFCDWYVEFVKTRLRDPSTRPIAQRVLAAVLDALCRLLHPIMPFLTEQIWQPLGPARPQPGAARAPSRPSRASASPPGRVPWAWQRRRGPGHGRPVAGEDPGDPQPPGRAERPPGGQGRADHRGRRTGRRAAPPGRGSSSEPDRMPARSRSPRRPTVPPSRAVAVLADAEVILPLEGLIDKQAEWPSSQEPGRPRPPARPAPGQAGQRGVRLAGPGRGRRGPAGQAGRAGSPARRGGRPDRPKRTARAERSRVR